MRPSALASKIRPGVFAELQKKIDDRAAAGAQIVGLHIGDTHLSPPEEARWGKIAPPLDVSSTYRYGATAALGDLRASLAAHVTKARGVPDLGPDHVLVGAGGTHALYCVAKAILDPGDEVIAFAPYWPLAHGIFTSIGARVNELSISQRLYAGPLDLRAELEKSVGPRTRAIYFVSPNNPDGKILDRDSLQTILAFAIEHDLFVFADEVYADIVYGDAPAVSFGSLPNAMERSALVYSFSKSHALAGHRVGYVVAPKDVISFARRVSVHTVFNVPVLSQKSAHVALQHGAAFQRDAVAAYRRARSLACEGLSAIEGVRFFPPEGATYVFADFTELLAGKPLLALLENMLEEGVLLAPGESFGAAFGTFARVCFTSVPEQDLARGLAAMKRATEKFVERSARG